MLAKDKKTDKKVDKKQSKKDSRVRNWTFIEYPESAPDNWRLVLDDLHIKWVESPLHDKDTNPDGTVKKPHWHVMLCFSSKKSYQQILKICRGISGTNPQRVEDITGLVRYMAHLDNPEKYQYDTGLIVGHGGFDVGNYLVATRRERYSIIRDMMAWVDMENITEMKDLLDYAMREHFEDWFPLLCDNAAYVMGVYIKSNRFKSLDD